MLGKKRRNRVAERFDSFIDETVDWEETVMLDYLINSSVITLVVNIYTILAGKTPVLGSGETGVLMQWTLFTRCCTAALLPPQSLALFDDAHDRWQRWCRRSMDGHDRHCRRNARRG